MAGRGQARLRLFLDSSVAFSATLSPTGGSAKIFTLGDQFELVSSNVVLAESENNIKKKLKHTIYVDRFFKLASLLAILPQSPDEKLINQAKLVIAEKDAVILAEAKQAQTDYLVTLDKKDFLKPKPQKWVEPTRIVTPKGLFSELS